MKRTRKSTGETSTCSTKPKASCLMQLKRLALSSGPPDFESMLCDLGNSTSFSSSSTYSKIASSTAYVAKFRETGGTDSKIHDVDFALPDFHEQGVSDQAYKI